MPEIVITGVDRTKTAKQAAQKAATLAAALGADLYVISAYGESETKTVAEGIDKVTIMNLEEAERIASEVSLELQHEFPGLRIISTAAKGKPGPALVREAAKLGAGTIVVGNKRVQGPARLLGSIARTVASEAKGDVYIVNTHQR